MLPLQWFFPFMAIPLLLIAMSLCHGHFLFPSIQSSYAVTSQVVCIALSVTLNPSPGSVSFIICHTVVVAFNYFSLPSVLHFFQFLVLTSGFCYFAVFLIDNFRLALKSFSSSFYILNITP